MTEQYETPPALWFWGHIITMSLALAVVALCSLASRRNPGFMGAAVLMSLFAVASGLRAARIWRTMRRAGPPN